MVPLNSKLGLSKDELEAFNRETETLLDKALQWQCNSNVLISGEGIGFMDESDLLGLRDYLSAYFDSVRIVCYVRTPISYMQSAFQERVKGRLGSFHADELYKSYKKRFEKIESVFGESSCDFWKFDPKAFRSSDVVLDFCDRLNIELGQVEINRVNDSLSLNALKLLFAYRKFGPGYGVGKNVVSENALLIRALGSIGGGKLALGGKLVRELLNQNKKDIQWMESRLGESLDEEIAESDDSIYVEDDLLEIDPKSIDTLKKLIGQKELTDTISGSTPQEVAQLVHILRNKLSGKPIHDGVLVNSSDHLSVQMPTITKDSAVPQNKIDVSTLVTALKSKDSKILDGIPDRRAEQIISDALRVISSHIDNAEGGLLRIAQLGNFRIREAPAGSFQAKRGTKRIVFRPKNR